jgi:hypothetical protein
MVKIAANPDDCNRSHTTVRRRVVEVAGLVSAIGSFGTDVSRVQIVEKHTVAGSHHNFSILNKCKYALLIDYFTWR